MTEAVAEVLAGLLAGSAIALAGIARDRSRRAALLERAGRPALDRTTTQGRRWVSPAKLSRWLTVPGLAIAWVIGGRVAGPPGSVAGVVAAVLVPRVVARSRDVRREEELDAQLADAVSAVGAAIRSGRSLEQALAYAGAEVSEPLGPSLAAVADRARLGMPFGASLDAWIRQLGSADVRLVGAVLKLHRRTGGALPRVLDGLARTLRERRSAAREVRSLTAQARLSALILGLLPIGFFLFLSATSRDDIRTAYHTPAGATAIGIGLLLQGAASLWIRSLLRVEP